MDNRSVVLCHPVRTAIGTYGGTLKNSPAPQLGGVAIRATLERAALAADRIDSVVMGHVVQAGTKMNSARQAAIAAGLPVSTPAMTVNRVCGSGAQAIVSAALEVAAGNVDCAIAGGMENMDMAPYLVPGGRWGYRMGDATLYDSMLLDGLHDAFSGEHSGWHTEDLAAKFGISREQQDSWAARSQQRFGAAQAAGKFDAEIVAVMVRLLLCVRSAPRNRSGAWSPIGQRSNGIIGKPDQQHHRRQLPPARRTPVGRSAQTGYAASGESARA